jgi:hypothetical protein
MASPVSGSTDQPEFQLLLSEADSERAEDLASTYLDPEARFCHDILRTHDDPRELADSPVDTTLEHELCDTSTRSFYTGDSLVAENRELSRETVDRVMSRRGEQTTYDDGERILRSDSI